MAGLCIGSPRDLSSYIDIDYSVVDGHIRSFSVGGEVLYDEDVARQRCGTMKMLHDEDIGGKESWEQNLVDIVKAYKLDKDNGRGLHAFVIKLINEGKIS